MSSGSAARRELAQVARHGGWPMTRGARFGRPARPDFATLRALPRWPALAPARQQRVATVALLIGAQSALGRTVRIGKPAGLRGLPEAHAGPAFGTLAGLILYAKNEPLDLRSLSTMTQQSYRQASPGLVQRLVHAFRANF